MNEFTVSGARVAYVAAAEPDVLDAPAVVSGEVHEPGGADPMMRRVRAAQDRAGALIKPEKAPVPPIDAVVAPLLEIAEFQLEWEKRVERNRPLSHELTRQIQPFDGDKAMRALLMGALQRFHAFEYACVEHPPLPIETQRPLHADRLEAIATGPQASGDFFDNLKELIGMIGGDYLAVYERLIEQYSAMFKDFNEKIMARMGEWVKSVNEGKEVELNSVALMRELDALIAKWSRAPAGALFPVPNADGSLPPTSFEDARQWAAAMGLPASAVRPTGDGGYYVQMDLAPLVNMRASLQGLPGTMDSAKFQAWQAGFNSQEAAMKNYLQVATSKYSNANAYHDNFIKILSSQLSQFAEMLKAYLN